MSAFFPPRPSSYKLVNCVEGLCDLLLLAFFESNAHAH